jgi:hypothetical protein
MLAALKAIKDTDARGVIVTFVTFSDDEFWLIACPYSHRAVCDVEPEAGRRNPKLQELGVRVGVEAFARNPAP